ncbi:MAG TPA: ISAs1 family transposase [Dehalococcoidia bacterium]|nr:ISAs1 family transposase [Dehalococcoidia bacterium]
MAFGRSKEAWLRTFLALPHGIPSHDTCGRVFAALDPRQFEGCFLSWVWGVARQTRGEVVALDGKTLRRSHARAAGPGALQRVSAWATTNRLVLGHGAVDRKATEITARPELLRVLAREGCSVTIDAAGGQTASARTIRQPGGDAVLALKGTPGTAHDTGATDCAAARPTGCRDLPHGHRRTVDSGHGRVETRPSGTVTNPDLLASLTPTGAWTDLARVGLVERERRCGSETSHELHAYRSSLAGHADTCARAGRGHGGSANRLPGVLDSAFREDERRVRTGHAAEHFAVLRHSALHLLRPDSTTPVGVTAKRLKAGWDEAYLLRILAT